MGWLVHIAGDARELRMKKRRAEPESDMVESRGGRKKGRQGCIRIQYVCIIDIIFMDIKYSGSDRYRHHKFVIDIDIIKYNF